MVRNKIGKKFLMVYNINSILYNKLNLNHDHSLQINKGFKIDYKSIYFFMDWIINVILNIILKNGKFLTSIYNIILFDWQSKMTKAWVWK